MFKSTSGNVDYRSEKSTNLLRKTGERDINIYGHDLSAFANREKQRLHHLLTGQVLLLHSYLKPNNEDYYRLRSCRIRLKRVS